MIKYLLLTLDKTRGERLIYSGLILDFNVIKFPEIEEEYHHLSIHKRKWFKFILIDV